MRMGATKRLASGQAGRQASPFSPARLRARPPARAPGVRA